MHKVLFKIKRLGAIRDAEIELKPFMVFSGESGLGKSYLAFLVYYLHILLGGKRLANFFEENGYQLHDQLSSYADGEEVFRVSSAELFQWINRDAITYIGYLIGHRDFSGEVEIDLGIPESEFIFVIHKEFKGLKGQEEVTYSIECGKSTFTGLKNDTKFLDAFKWFTFGVILGAELQNQIFSKHLRFTFLFPPARGVLMELNERPSFKSGMYQEFYDFKNYLELPLRQTYTIPPSMSEALRRVNDGDISKNEEGIFYLVHGATIPLTAAASSIKELAPLSLALTKFAPSDLSIMLEEPEAHLHPRRQMAIADVIAIMVNQGARMQVTTHSDYFIKRLNMLMSLHKLCNSDANQEGKIDEILDRFNIDKHSLLDPAFVGAYVFTSNPDGTSSVKRNATPEKGISYETFYQTVEDELNHPYWLML